MAPVPSPSGIITLTSDFGAIDPYVAIMKGAVLCACRRATVVDVVHEVPPQDVAAGAFFIGALVDRFPSGTVHLAVVDPGVGSERRVLAVTAANAYWLAPDNGVLTPILARGDARTLAVDLVALGIRPRSRTFHGRDVFAPLAGRLAGGTLGFASLGSPIEDAVRLPDPQHGQIIVVDRFGNLLTNELAGGEDGRLRGLRVADRDAPIVGCYADALTGALVSLVNSYGTLEIAIVGGNAARELGVGAGTRVERLVVPS